jgi:hypothetical protein
VDNSLGRSMSDRAYIGGHRDIVSAVAAVVVVAAGRRFGGIR